MARPTDLVQRLCKAVMSTLTRQLMHLEHCAYEVTDKLPAQTNRLPLALIPPNLALCTRQPRVTGEVMRVTQKALLTKVSQEMKGRATAQDKPPLGYLSPALGQVRDVTGLRWTYMSAGRSRLQPRRERQVHWLQPRGHFNQRSRDAGGRGAQRGPTRTGRKGFPGPQKLRLRSEVSSGPAPPGSPRFRRPSPGPAGSHSGRCRGRSGLRPIEPSFLRPRPVKARRGARKKPRDGASHSPAAGPLGCLSVAASARQWLLQAPRLQLSERAGARTTRRAHAGGGGTCGRHASAAGTWYLYSCPSLRVKLRCFPVSGC